MEHDDTAPIALLRVVWRYQTIIEAAVTREGLERQLREIERQVARLGKTRSEMSDHVADAFAGGRHETDQDRAHLATLLLWLAASDDEATAARLRRGSVVVTWMVHPPANAGETWDLAYRLDDMPTADAARPTLQ